MTRYQAFLAGKPPGYSVEKWKCTPREYLADPSVTDEITTTNPRYALWFESVDEAESVATGVTIDLGTLFDLSIPPDSNSNAWIYAPRLAGVPTNDQK